MTSDIGFSESQIFFNKISESKEIKEKFKFLIERTKTTGVEHGTNICKKNNNVIIPDKACRGIKCMVRHEQIKCPKDSKSVGSFHTHPSGAIIPSLDDVRVSAHEKIFCIGGVNDMVRCFYPFIGYAKYIGDIDLSKEKQKKIKVDTQKTSIKLFSPEDVIQERISIRK